MSKPKLTYFNFRGRAELSRYILIQAEVEFEDVRISFEDWPQLKPNTLCRCLPELECDGIKLSQSMTIARYLANKFGLAGKSAEDKAKANMIVDITNDLLPQLVAVYKEQDTVKKEELEKKVKEEVIPQTLTVLEKLLTENNGGDLYLVGDNVTWADMQVSLMKDWPATVGVTLDLEPYPKLKALVDRVESLPKIKHWIETRPKTSR